MNTWLILSLICLCIAGSIWLRMRRRRADWENNLQIIPGETKQSFISKAVQDWIATAGGIYLALILVVSFLKLNIPPTVILDFWGGTVNGGQSEISFDPLALIAIGLAVIEPAVIKIKNIIKDIVKNIAKSR